MNKEVVTAIPGQGIVTAKSRQRVTLSVILFITCVIAYLDRVNVSVLIADPKFISDMGITGQPVKMGLLMTLFLVTYGIFGAVLGPLGDKIGPRKAMMVSIFLWTISIMMGGLAPTFAIMLISRLILGSGEGLHWPMQFLFTKNWFPPKERGKANSAFLLGIMVGPAIAMPFFTWIIAAYGWRTSFFALGLLGLIPLFLLWRYVTDHPHQHKKISKAELEYIESGLKEEAATESQKKIETLRDCFASFCLNYRFWLVTINHVCICGIWFGMMAWLPSYLRSARGFSWAAMGGLSALPYILGSLSILYFGYLSDKLGRRSLLVAIGHLSAATSIYFGAQAASNITAAVVISFGVVAMGLSLPSSWAVLQKITPAKAVGASAGLMSGVGNIVSAFIPVIIGYFIAVTGSYMGGLMFLVGLGVLGFLCMSVLALQKY
jgi:sugar phosphate permease